MKQQKKITKTNVEVDANYEGIALKYRGNFNRPHNEGITLISLVITIVIMLILVGAAISINVNEGNLFGQANNAVTQWNDRVGEEQNAINNVLSYLPADTPSDLPEGWEKTKVASVVKQTSTIAGEEKERIAPIPVGYTASEIVADDEGKGAENTIAGGLVIYQTGEGETAVTGKANSDAHIAAMETRNQYVWIPVDDINDMVMCKYNNKTKKIDDSATEGGKTVCELEYNVAENKIICKTHGYDTDETLLTTSNIDTIGLAGRLYGADPLDSDGDGIFQTNMDFTATNQTFSKDSGYREPDLVTNYDKDDVTTDAITSNDYMSIAGVSSAEALKAQLNADFISMAKSVAKYGGFYISRYEAGANGASLKNQKVLVAGTDTESVTGYDTDTFINGNMWYGMYNTLKSSTAANKTAVNSHMIWRVPV